MNDPASLQTVQDRLVAKRPRRPVTRPGTGRSGTGSFVDSMIAALVVLYLVAAAGATANLLTPVDPTGKMLEGSGLLTISWLALYGISAPFIITSLRPSITLREVVLFAFAGLAIAGVAWSKMPNATLMYGFSLIANLAFAWACHRHLSLERFERILLFTLNALIVIGLLMAVVGLPHAYYFDPIDRANLLGTVLVRGLFSHKIYAGFYAAIAFAMNIQLLRNPWRWPMAATCALAVLVSGSSLGLVTLLLVCVLMVLLPRLQDLQLRLLFLVMMLFGTVVALLSWQTLFADAVGALGRDVTLTGRTTLWAYAVQFWSEKPVLGWAYGGIFGDDPNAPGAIVNVDKYYQAPHFHDVYLQVAAEMGSVGFLLFSTILFMTIGTALRNTWTLRRPVDTVSAIFALSLAVIGTVMNIGARYNELSTILLAYFFLATGNGAGVWRALPRPSSGRVRAGALQNRASDR
ncbi:MAG: hypothetical protein ABT11_15875 [Novosphingobium sp. SCN 66-18]|nr:MAG: hypothetical protein ABT11_15875 [Novosphingobium sp. SCN 66-18]